MSCSNCYGGCPEIVSDKCVKYTGIDIPVLGIKNGDSLSYVEQALITFLTSTLDGTGIKVDIDSDIICQIVDQYLPTCGDITIVDVVTALIKAVCDLKNQIDEIGGEVAAIEANYTIDCLEGVSADSGTHAIVQAVINKLCTLSADFEAFVTDVETNYVQLADLNNLIQTYLDSLTTSTKQYTKMVPYTVVEYYGSLANFDATGAGLGDWEKIYLCNGLNGTPDKRGRVPVGAIQLVPGNTPDPAVNPAADPTFNPNYAIGDTGGANKITLTQNQIPSHNHSATVTPNPHSHPIPVSSLPGGGSLGRTSSGDANLSTDPTTLTVSIGYTGGGLPHSNIQPVLACYYIIYLP